MLPVLAAELQVVDGSLLDDVDVGAGPELVRFAPLAGRAKQSNLKNERFVCKGVCRVEQLKIRYNAIQN